MIRQWSANTFFLSSIITALLLLFTPSALPTAGWGTSQIPAGGRHCGDAMAATDRSGGSLRVELAFTRGETSKDGHQHVYSCRISGGRVTYYGPYGKCERGECPHRKTEFVLTADQEAALIKGAESWGLFKNYNETRPRNNIGTWFKVSLSIAAKERAGEIRIEGMDNNWNMSGIKSAEISGPAKEKLAAVDRLRRAIMDIAVKHYPRYHS